MRAYREYQIDYFQDEEGVFTAVVPAIRGCVASGTTLEEAYENAVDAIESCLEAREIVVAPELQQVKYSGVNVYRRPVHA
jgi:predicted RNase H-like HicB family nuclease